MRDVNLTARVLKIYHPRTFEKDGVTNVVQSLLLGDKDGTIKLVLWGPDTQPVTDGKIKRGTICQLIGGYIRKGWDNRIEIHKGRRGRLQIDPKDIDTSGYPDPGKYIMKLTKFKPGEDDIDFYARVGEIGSLKTFSKKDGTMGRLSWLTVMDETAQTRLVFWNERAEETLNFKPGNTILVEGASCKEGFRDPVNPLFRYQDLVGRIFRGRAPHRSARARQSSHRSQEGVAHEG